MGGDFGDDVAQLRDLLTAEQSTEVTDEDQQHELRSPGAAQDDGLAVGIRDFDVCQPSGRISHHVESFRWD